jgi:hypothetical protein
MRERGNSCYNPNSFRGRQTLRLPSPFASGAPIIWDASTGGHSSTSKCHNTLCCDYEIRNLLTFEGNGLRVVLQKYSWIMRRLLRYNTVPLDTRRT